MPDDKKVTGDGVSDEGFLGTLIPMIFMIAVSAATYLLMDYVDYEDPVSGVLVYSIADWVPTGSNVELSPQKVQAFIAKSEQAVNRAADAGYVVIPINTVKAASSANRIKPGMFPPVSDGGSDE